MFSRTVDHELSSFASFAAFVKPAEEILKDCDRVLHPLSLDLSVFGPGCFLSAVFSAVFSNWLSSQAKAELELVCGQLDYMIVGGESADRIPIQVRMSSERSDWSNPLRFRCLTSSWPLFRCFSRKKHSSEHTSGPSRSWRCQQNPISQSVTPSHT